MITTIIRTAILYVFVILGIRLMGKRQIGDMQPSELVITLLISEIAAIPLQDINQPILNGITAIFVLVILEIVLSVLAMKSFILRKLISGKSVVLIKNGVLDQKAMKSVRITVLDLVELLRSQEVFDISKINYAVLEVNGDLNVLLKAEYQPATTGDLNIKNSSEGLPLPIISDGLIINDSLKALDITQEKLENILKKHKQEVKDIFLMTLDRYGNTNIIERNTK